MVAQSKEDSSHLGAHEPSTAYEDWSIQQDKQRSRTLRICHLLTSCELLTLLAFCSLRPLQYLKVMRYSSSFRTQTYHNRSTNPWWRVDPERCVKKQRDQAKKLACCCWRARAGSECFVIESTCSEGWAVFTLHLSAIRFFFYLTFRTDSPPCHCSRNQICSDCVVNTFIYITYHFNSVTTTQKDQF